MTKLVLEIPKKSDLEALLPLFERLRIKFINLDDLATKSSGFELSEAELEALDQIVAEFEANPSTGVDAFEAMKSIRAQNVP